MEIYVSTVFRWFVSSYPGPHVRVVSLQHPLELKPGLAEAAAHAGHPAVGAVQLYHVSAARLVMQLVHILGDQTAHLRREVIIFVCTDVHFSLTFPLASHLARVWWLVLGRKPDHRGHPMKFLAQ